MKTTNLLILLIGLSAVLAHKHKQGEEHNHDHDHDHDHPDHKHDHDHDHPDHKHDPSVVPLDEKVKEQDELIEEITVLSDPVTDKKKQIKVPKISLPKLKLKHKHGEKHNHDHDHDHEHPDHEHDHDHPDHKHDHDHDHPDHDHDHDHDHPDHDHDHDHPDHEHDPSVVQLDEKVKEQDELIEEITVLSDPVAHKYEHGEDHDHPDHDHDHDHPDHKHDPSVVPLDEKVKEQDELIEEAKERYAMLKDEMADLQNYISELQSTPPMGPMMKDQTVIRPCEKRNGGCSHICMNKGSSAVCRCPRGFFLRSDLKSCAYKKVKDAPKAVDVGPKPVKDARKEKDALTQKTQLLGFLEEVKEIVEKGVAHPFAEIIRYITAEAPPSLWGRLIAFAKGLKARVDSGEITLEDIGFKLKEIEGWIESGQITTEDIMGFVSKLKRRRDERQKREKVRYLIRDVMENLREKVAKDEKKAEKVKDAIKNVISRVREKLDAN